MSESTLRFLPADSLARFLTDADLEIEEQFGDWSGQPFTETSPEIITIARRRSARSRDGAAGPRNAS